MTAQAPASVAADDLAVPEELSGRRLRSRLLIVGAIVVVAIAVITLVPGLASLRSRFAQAHAEWIAVAVVLKLLSGAGYVLVFRAVFCERMPWGLSFEIGFSELAANALFPTGGAGGLALGAWALRRGGMPAGRIARRTVAFFLLTSAANVGALFAVAVGLATGLLPGDASLPLTVVPAAAALSAVVATFVAGRLSGRLERRLRGGERARVVGALAAVSNGVDEAFALLRRHDWRLIAGSLAYLGFDIMVLWATFRAFGSSPELAIIWIAYLIGELGGLIPVPGGIGGIDVGLVGMLVVYGVDASAATAAVLAYRAVALWTPALVGGTAFLALRRTLRTEAEQIALCADGAELDIVGAGKVVVSRTTATADRVIPSAPSG